MAAPVTATATLKEPVLLPPNVLSPKKQDILDYVHNLGEDDKLNKDFKTIMTNGNEYWYLLYIHEFDEFFISAIDMIGDGAKPNLVRDIMLTSTTQLGNGINRAEVEQVITDEGYNLPQITVTFYIKDTDNDVWFVHYLKELDAYSVEKLVLKA
jgi:hypothetical protein